MHTEITDEIRDTVSLWSLGALAPEEADAFERHLDQCDLCRAEADACQHTAALLAGAVPELRPDPSLRTRLLDATRPPPSSMHVVRDGEGKWTPTPFPGITVKYLFIDRATKAATLLLRMEPGATYPPHRHRSAEQCLVLEGDIRLGATVLGPGDYTRSEALSTHGVLSTAAGCTALLMASLDDELL